jgi:hypothetical protein
MSSDILPDITGGEESEDAPSMNEAIHPRPQTTVSATGPHPTVVTATGPQPTVVTGGRPHPTVITVGRPQGGAFLPVGRPQGGAFLPVGRPQPAVVAGGPPQPSVVPALRPQATAGPRSTARSLFPTVPPPLFEVPHPRELHDAVPLLPLDLTADEEAIVLRLLFKKLIMLCCRHQTNLLRRGRQQLQQ